MPPPAFSVLVVCRANICRSPAAAALLQAALPPDVAVTVTSAGTHALIGHEVDLAVVTALREAGVRIAEHEARQATSELVASTDLLLAAARSHLPALFESEAAAGRTFTLREFARLGAALGPVAAPTPATLRERVAQLDALRPGPGPAAPGLDDIGDPFGAPFDEVRRCVAVIAAAVDGCVAALGL